MEGWVWSSVFVVRDRDSGSKHMIPEDRRGNHGVVILEHIQQFQGGRGRLGDREGRNVTHRSMALQISADNLDSTSNGVKLEPGFEVSQTDTLCPSKCSSY